MAVSSDQALRDDIHLLGDLLGETLRTQEGQHVFEMVERVRALEAHLILTSSHLCLAVVPRMRLCRLRARLLSF